MVDATKRILVLTPSRAGKLHDKRFHDEDDIAGAVPDAIAIEVDLGFLGWQKEYDNIRLPQRQPKGGALNPAQKEENRALSQSRVISAVQTPAIKQLIPTATVLYVAVSLETAAYRTVALAQGVIWFR